VKKVRLSKYGIPDFYVEPLAETKYGLDFWDSAENGSWESDQLADLSSLARVGCYFIDIGASNGVYSLIMASLGCDVIAIEPDEAQFAAMKVNLNLNPDLKIESRKGLVVSSSGISLSPYALDIKSNDVKSLEKIDFTSLLKIDEMTIIKIDIEGGEWALLRDKRIVSHLRRHKNLRLSLSPHIGFFSKNYHKGVLYRLQFRLSVLRELLTLYFFSRKANSITYLGAKTSPGKLVRIDRILGGPGLRGHIIFEFKN